MNKLIGENSPYLLQHADNPVDWYPWGEEALNKAKNENKPIFLSIGYAACHWCHVMEGESFNDPAIASIMNKNFVCIKVDREERPDIDNIYMNAVVAMTGQGGWPLNIFLTPDCKPFYGGTYFPPIRRYSLPSFRDVLLSIAQVWQEDRQKIQESSERITQHIQKALTMQVGIAKLNQDSLQKASMALVQSYDWDHGGWGQAPKFPQAMAIEYLLRRASLGDKFSLEVGTHALDVIAKGGMYDVVGGGFSRYSTDNQWLVPHFEKMLYDNAQLAQVYLYAYLLTGKSQYRKLCEKTLTFVQREMMDPSGGFYSSLDADSEGEEGKFYVWTPEEISQAVKNDSDITFITKVYGITKEGNFEGKNVLQQDLTNQALAEYFDMKIDAFEERLEKIHEELLHTRSQRIRPNTDDKVITSWNSLMMLTFAEAGRYLHRPDYVAIARQNAEFILNNMLKDGILLRSWRNGHSAHYGYLEDYAALMLSLLALYQSDPNPYWFTVINHLLGEIQTHFNDVSGGFYDTRDDGEQLLIRPKDIQDNAIPSGNAMAAHALLIMNALTGVGEFRDKAEEMLTSMQDIIIKYPLGYAKWLTALELALNSITEVAILGDPKESITVELRDCVWTKYRPHIIVAQDNFPPMDDSPPLLHNRTLKDGLPTAYVCQNFVCHQPVNTPEALVNQLNMTMRSA